MNYSQAAALQSAIVQMKVAAESLAAHTNLARDIATRAGLRKDGPFGEYGMAAVLDLLSIKASFLPTLFGDQLLRFLDKHLAEQGDAIAINRLAKQARAKEEADEQTARAVRKRRRTKNVELRAATKSSVANRATADSSRA